MSGISVPIIAYHRSALPQKFGLPRQPGLVGLPSYVQMCSPYHTPAAFIGIEQFSHLWLIWQAHHNRAQKTFKPQVRPPRLGGNQKLGVFATRSTYRPAGLAQSVVRLLAVEPRATGVWLHISGADLIDATPIVDIKPYLPYSDAIASAQGGFAPNAPSSQPVSLQPGAKQQFVQLLNTDAVTKSTPVDVQRLVANDLDWIIQLIAQDPRPAYRQNQLGAEFVMRYKHIDVCFEQTHTGLAITRMLLA